MKKLLLLLLCVPLMSLGQYEPTIGSQERKDISEAIRDSVGQEYLCQYYTLLINEDVAYTSLELVNRYTNEVDTYYWGIFLKKDDNGWYVVGIDYDIEIILESYNVEAMELISEKNYERALETLNRSRKISDIFLYRESEYFYEYVRSEEFAQEIHECLIDTIFDVSSIFNWLNDTSVICNGCDTIINYQDFPQLNTGVQYEYVEIDASDLLTDFCFYFLDSTVFSEKDCDYWCERLDYAHERSYYVERLLVHLQETSNPTCNCK